MNLFLSPLVCLFAFFVVVAVVVFCMCKRDLELVICHGARASGSTVGVMQPHPTNNKKHG